MNEIATVLQRTGLLSPEEREHWKMAWLSTVDHKRIGILYMVTGLVFFVIGGVEALLIRLQLSRTARCFIPTLITWYSPCTARR